MVGTTLRITLSSSPTTFDVAELRLTGRRKCDKGDSATAGG